ncbi:hypothetical protein TWF718_010923 [Orbilia javanica]|uniref:Uncharacterized protein n=1 Tax=Orbilia javanica TaxID=47235 RepID=A0AAN8MKH6_9PEZI
MNPSTILSAKDTAMPSQSAVPTTFATGSLPEDGTSTQDAAVAPDSKQAPESIRWSDYDDDDDDWVPEILLPKPTEPQASSQGPELGEEPQSQEIVEVGGGEGEIPDNGIWYDERFGQYVYGGEPISCINGDLVTPQEWIHDPNFEGFWQDKVTKRVHLYCQNPLALAVHANGQSRWLNDSYYWARHPMTVPLSKYELLTSEFNSIAPNPTRRGGPSMGKAEWARGATTRELGPPVVASSDTPPTEMPTGHGEADEGPANEVACAAEEAEQVGGKISEEAIPADSEVVGVSVNHQDVSGPSELVPTPPVLLPPQPTAIAAAATDTDADAADIPSPRPPEGPVLMTPLEFLISRGLYRDRPPPPRQKNAEGPVKSRLQGLRPSWASKLRSPVRSLTTAYRKAGDKIAHKCVAPA